MKKQVEFGGLKSGYFSRNRFVDKDSRFKEARRKIMREYNNTDVYQTVLETWTDEDGNKQLYGPLYLDIDGDGMTPEGFEAVKQDALLAVHFLISKCHVPEDQVRLYFSGSKGFHIIVPPETLGIEPSENLHHRYKSFAQYVDTFTLHYGVDKAIYDNRRLFRITGSINSKTGLFKVPVRIDALYGMSHEAMLRYACKPKIIRWTPPVFCERAQEAFNEALERIQPKAIASKETKDLVFEDGEILPCVQYLLDNGASQGNRNNTCVAIASSLMQNGHKPSEVSEMMLEWNEKNEPPLPEHEVLTTVKSAHQLLVQGRGYGCTFFKDAGYCQDGCPLLKE